MSDATDPQLKAALEAAGADMGVELTGQQVERMLQLHLACEQRIGVIIMGPSGSGKSTLWQVSESAHTATLQDMNRGPQASTALGEAAGVAGVLLLSGRLRGGIHSVF